MCREIYKNIYIIYIGWGFGGDKALYIIGIGSENSNWSISIEVNKYIYPKQYFYDNNNLIN